MERVWNGFGKWGFSWTRIGKVLERHWKGEGSEWLSGGSHSAAQGLFHDALSEGVVARCLLQVVDKLRGAMLSCVTAVRGGGGQRGRRGQCFCGLFAFGGVGVFCV